MSTKYFYVLSKELMDEYESEIKNLKYLVEGADNVIGMLEDILEKKNDTSNDMNKKIEELTAKNRDLNYMIIESDYETDNLIEENVKLKKNNERLKKDISNLRKDVDTLKGLNACYEKSESKRIDDLLEENEHLKKQNEHLKKDNYMIIECDYAMDDLIEENVKLKKHIESINKDNEALKEDNDKLKRLNECYKKSDLCGMVNLVDLVDENNKLKKEIDDLKELNGSYKELSECYEKLDSWTNDVIKYYGDLTTELAEDNLKFLEENEQLKKTVEALKYSLEKALEELEYDTNYR